MASGGFRALGSALVLAMLGVGLWILVPKLLGGAAGTPDVQVLTILHDRLIDGVSLEVPGTGSPLLGGRVRLGPTTVHLDEGGQRAIAVAMLDLTGRLDQTEVSSLGYERVPFVRTPSGKWAVEGSLAPRLTSAVAALESRRLALERGDPATLASLADEGAPPAEEVSEIREFFALRGRSYQSKSWVMRSERDRTEVAEHYRVQGDTPDRPVDRKGLRNLTLVPRGDALLFSPGLM